MSDDEWVTGAMDDSILVAEVLVRLRVATSPPFKKPTTKRPRTRPAPPQTWTIHQRRSRTQPLLSASNKSEEPRASPSTPLSWSGGTSVSGGALPIADDLPNPNRSDISISRSKVTETNPTKRPRKKKTLAALKEEEVLLMEEQKQLKRKLASLQATCEEHIKENERLKKMTVERPNGLRCVDKQQRKDKVVIPDLNAPACEDVAVSY